MIGHRAQLQKQIAVMETCNLSDKPWQMVGEVTDHTRPVNSLLEEDLDFEQMSRPQPVITEEKTRSLEDVIKQRVIDEVRASLNCSDGVFSGLGMSEECNIC